MKNNSLVVWNDDSRKKLREKQIEMLLFLINICEKYGLTYFAVGGTALGAVRHAGYIPWDDDIDIALPRRDYMAFLEVAQVELPKGFFLQNHITDPDYRNDFSKIRNSNTIFLESSASQLKINHGIYIDVFPIDGYPKYAISGQIIEIYKKLSKIYLGKDYIQKNTSKSHRIALFIAKMLYGRKTTTNIIDNLEHLYMKYPYEKMDIVVCHGGAWGKKERLPRDYYGQGVKGAFEGISVCLPEKTHEYLMHKYGDYMQLPPIEKRIAHHYCEKIEFECAKEEKL